jgi:hypothetical protein
MIGKNPSSMKFEKKKYPKQKKKLQLKQLGPNLKD